MHVLVTNWRDVEHPDAGGAEVFTHEVLKRLAERGHEATLFASAFDDCEAETVVDGVRVVRSGGRLTVYRDAKKHYRRRFRGEVDVVVDEINTRPFMTPDYVEEPVVALVHQLAREIWFHETPFPMDRIGYHWLEERWLKRYADVPAVTVSESTKRDLQALGVEDVTIVPQGLGVEPVEKMPETADVPTFLFVGRLTAGKRPRHALAAFERLRRWLPDARLHVVGDGSLLDELRASAGERVTLHGHVSEAEKRELMKRSHVLLVPSVREGWGLVVTEANAMGTPAVGYDVPGLRDSIQDGETGALCEAEPRTLAEAARRVFEERREEFASAAIRHAEQFHWDKTARELEKKIEEVVNDA